MLTSQRSRNPLFPVFLSLSLTFSFYFSSTFSTFLSVSSLASSCNTTSEPLVGKPYGINYKCQENLLLSNNITLTMDYNLSYQPYQHNRFIHQPTNTFTRQQPSSVQLEQTSSQQYQQEVQPHEIPHVRYIAEGLPRVKVSTYTYNQTGAQILYPLSSNQEVPSNHLHPPPAPPSSANTSPQTHHHQHLQQHYPFNNPSSSNLWSVKTPLTPHNAAVRQQYQPSQYVLPPTSPLVSVPYPYASAAACGSSDSSSPTAYPYPVAATITAQQQREQNQQMRHIQQQNSQLNEQFIFPHLIHQRQRGLQPIDRKWYLWAIGIMDIIAVVWTTSLVIRDAFLKPIAGKINDML